MDRGFLFRAILTLDFKSNLVLSEDRLPFLFTGGIFSGFNTSLRVPLFLFVPEPKQVGAMSPHDNSRPKCVARAKFSLPGFRTITVNC